MKQVIVFPRGQLTKEDRAAIAKAGAVAVEADDPSKVTIALSSPIDGNDLFMSMMEALTLHANDSTRSAVVQELGARARKNEGAKP